MLNRMLVVDFSALSKKWWLFLLLGWGEYIGLHGAPGVCVVLQVHSKNCKICNSSNIVNTTDSST